MNDRFGARLGQCLVGSVAHVAIAVGNFNVRQAFDGLDVELRIHGVTLGRQAEPVGFTLDDHAQRAPWALERFGLDVDHLADVAARLDLVVHCHQHAFAPCILAARDRNGVVQVEHAVRRHRGAWAHGTDHHDRLVGFFHQVQEVGGFFKGVGAVGDHDAVDVLAVGQFGDTATQLQKVFVIDAFRRNLHHLFAANIGDLAKLRNAGDQLFDADLGRLVGGTVGSTGAGASDGTAGGEDDYVGQFGLAFDFLCLGGNGEQQQKGQGARNDVLQCRFHYFSLWFLMSAVAGSSRTPGRF